MIFSKIGFVRVGVALVVVAASLLAYGAGTPKQPIQVVAWTADWCKYCREDKPTLQKWIKDGKIVVIFVDFDEHKEFAKRYNIKYLPTYFVVKDDKIVYRTNKIAEILSPPKPQ